MTKVTIDTTFVSKCELAHLGGCDPQAVIRHHMGNDGLLKLACAAIRAQYWQFLDCAKLCDTHHMKVHYIYTLLKDEIMPKAMALMTQQELQTARAKYIELFFAIKSGSVKLKKVPKEFRAKWKQSRKAWQKKRR